MTQRYVFTKMAPVEAAHIVKFERHQQFHELLNKNGGFLIVSPYLFQKIHDQQRYMSIKCGFNTKSDCYKFEKSWSNVSINDEEKYKKSKITFFIKKILLKSISKHLKNIS